MAITLGFTVPKEPGVYARVDNSAARGSGISTSKALILGQMLAAGTATADELVFIPSASAARGYFGTGSMIAREIEAFFAAYPQAEVWAIPQDEPSGGVAATGTIVVGVTTAETGTVVIEIAGQVIEAAVTAGDSADDIGAAIAAAINAETSLPVTAVNATGTVTLTTRWKGLTGNLTTIRVNPKGAAAGQVLPGGVTLTVTDMGGVAAGTAAPDLTDSLAAIVGEFDVIVCPYADAASLEDIATLKAADWDPLTMKFGHVCTAYDDSYSGLITFAGTNLQNDPHTSVAPLPGENMPRPPWERAALFGAMTLKYQCNGADADLAQGFTAIELPGDIPCSKADEFTPTERNVLLGYGISSGYISGGKVYISRARTTYLTDESGTVDTSYYDQRTLFIIQRLIRLDKAAWLAKFQGATIVDDDLSVGGGLKVINVPMARGFFAGQYAKHRSHGLVVSTDTFLENLVVEVDDVEPTQLNVLYPPNISGWLAVSAWVVQFRIGG